MRAALVPGRLRKRSTGHAGTGAGIRNDFFCPCGRSPAAEWAEYLDEIRLSQNSVSAVVEVVAEGVPPGLGAPVYAKLDEDIVGI
ncbi:MAG: chorismate synthase [Nitratireductor sp.]